MLLFVTLSCWIREGKDSPYPNSASADIYTWAFLLLSLPMGRTRYFCQPVSDTYLARQWSSPWRCTFHSPGWKSTLLVWIWTLFCQTPMGWDELCWANCALGAQLSLCYLDAIWIPARHSVLRDLAPTPVLCLITLAQWAAGEQKTCLSLQ